MQEKKFSNGKIYDLIYKDKDYEKELGFIESLFPEKPEKILELGCGTGNYTNLLLKKGYDVLSLDLSKEMLEVAEKKIQEGNFVQSDIRDFETGEKYDACLVLFAVLGYVTENNDLEKVLQNIRLHLNPKGFLIFDVWNGLAVLNQKPEKRIKDVENEKIKVTRYATPKLDSKKHICKVNYKFIVKDKKTTSSSEIKEEHKMRFFFPQELKKYLEDSGFEVLKMCKSFELNGEVDENCWNMIVVAKLKD